MRRWLGDAIDLSEQLLGTGCGTQVGQDWVHTGTRPAPKSRTPAGWALGGNGLTQVHNLTTGDSRATIYEGGLNIKRFSQERVASLLTTCNYQQKYPKRLCKWTSPSKVYNG